MLKKTHRAFGFLASSLTLTACTPLLYEGVCGGDLMTATTQMILADGVAVLASTWPDRLEIIHRGLSHSIWPVFLLGLALVPLLTHPLWFGVVLGILLGWFFHLFGDAFSTAGIAWFYPFQKYKRYGSGAFVVKGFRGPFLPLYKVGDESFSFMPAVWWVLGILAFLFLWYRLGELIID